MKMQSLPLLLFSPHQLRQWACFHTEQLQNSESQASWMGKSRTALEFMRKKQWWKSITSDVQQGTKSAEISSVLGTNTVLSFHQQWDIILRIFPGDLSGKWGSLLTCYPKSRRQHFSPSSWPSCLVFGYFSLMVKGASSGVRWPTPPMLHNSLTECSWASIRSCVKYDCNSTSYIRLSQRWNEMIQAKPWAECRAHKKCSNEHWVFEHKLHHGLIGKKSMNTISLGPNCPTSDTVVQSPSDVWLCNPMDWGHQPPLSMYFPGKNIGVGCHFVLQGSFPNQRLNQRLLHLEVVVQSLSHVQLFATPWTATNQASLSFTISQSLLKFMSIESVMPSNYLTSHPLLSPSPPALNLSQHQGLFQWVGSSHQVAKVLELQLQHQPFQWIFRTDFL